MSFDHERAAEVPLTPLRAFVAVGRHGNFTRAGAALGVTQGAVSRHIASLEAFAGGRLFHRRGSTVEFTPSGLQLFEAVKDAMSTIEMTMQLLAQRGRKHDRLKVRTSMPSFAMTVVVPALGAYTAQHGVQIDRALRQVGQLGVGRGAAAGAGVLEDRGGDHVARRRGGGAAALGERVPLEHEDLSNGLER